ncbi:homogentisate phytyltransferase [Leptolyngbya sp. Heron Island J]|uniref:homogentisate phytyltransferase n=1 Tax=Leptolyngbya sp. Heron Island J TaxID=1385935 RepID=UPI0003B96452|nr:homogentisate phytyltransferase [Leptolyngbya sp. Heron Island J]ESA33055.1 homogentisate phytyltransferase [Leptolyngbya sp. Heron Island J]
MTKSALSPPSLNLLQSPIPWLRAFWKFSRPHTIVGTSLSILGLFGIAWAARHPSSGLSPGTFHIWQGVSALWLTWLACVCTNIYIVGLNQIEDVVVDRIDKPYLPIASGEFSSAQAKMLVGIACSGAILLAVVSHSLYLVVTVGLSLAIGTAYSLPPLQLKRFPLLGSLCALLVRGALVNLGLFLHACSQLDLFPQVPGRMWVLTLVVLVFGVAIALLKHLRDGNYKHQTNNGFTPANILQLVWWLLTICYAGLIVAALYIPAINTQFFIMTHGLALGYFWHLSRQVQPPDAADSLCLTYQEYYQFIWKLLFIEYLIFPTACLL